MIPAGDARSTWFTPAERMPTIDDGPRRFTNKVEVDVECADTTGAWGFLSLVAPIRR